MAQIKPVRLTPERMQEQKAPGHIRWGSWLDLPASVQWDLAEKEASEAKAFVRTCPIENMHDRPTKDDRHG